MKGGARIHKAVAGVAVTMIIGGLCMVTAGAAWSAGLHESEPHLRFDNDLRRAVLVIPNPPCPTRSLHCHWQLYVNRVDVPGPHQWAIGTRGVVSLPIEHCGDYQADALISTGSYYNWTYVTGIRYHIDYCPPNTTTTTTTAPPQPPPSSSTTSSTAAPKVAASSTTTPTSQLPFTASTTPDSVAATTTPPAAETSATLPFTGADLRPLVVLGSVLILLGGLLLTSYESRRRLLRRAAAVRLGAIADGTRRVSSWLLGL